MDENSGIIAAKRRLNSLHEELAMAAFTQIFVDQMDSNIIAVTRNCPFTCERVVLVAYTAFNDDSDTRPSDAPIKPLVLEGQLKDIIMEAQLQPVDDNGESTSEFQRDPIFVNGDRRHRLDMRTDVPLGKSRFLQVISDSSDSECQKAEHSKTTEIHFHDFRPGCVAIFR